jgi:hypothetical protein
MVATSKIVSKNGTKIPWERIVLVFDNEGIIETFKHKSIQFISVSKKTQVTVKIHGERKPSSTTSRKVTGSISDVTGFFN